MDKQGYDVILIVLIFDKLEIAKDFVNSILSENAFEFRFTVNGKGHYVYELVFLKEDAVMVLETNLVAKTFLLQQWRNEEKGFYLTGGIKGVDGKLYIDGVRNLPIQISTLGFTSDNEGFSLN